MSIPGGTGEFDLPAYHAWLHYPAKERLANLYGWVAQMAPLADSVTNLLQLLRDGGIFQKALATQGQFELSLPPGRTFQLLRIMIDERTGLLPEISANRLLISLRWVRQDANWKLLSVKEDVDFEFALCA
jgi:cell division protein ZapD